MPQATCAGSSNACDSTLKVDAMRSVPIRTNKTAMIVAAGRVETRDWYLLNFNHQCGEIGIVISGSDEIYLHYLPMQVLTIAGTPQIPCPRVSSSQSAMVRGGSAPQLPSLQPLRKHAVTLPDLRVSRTRSHPQPSFALQQ